MEQTPTKRIYRSDTERPVYDPSQFDRSYYGQGGHNGFPSYEYDSDEQRFQLALKMDLCKWVPHQSALFIGCARGFEVAYWEAQGKVAAGVDVSHWAIAAALPQVRDHCWRYDGSDLSRFGDRSFDLVAAFDVLTLVPEDMMIRLAREMRRVARRGIVFRNIVKNYRNAGTTVDGLDGVPFVCRPFDWWDRLFTEERDFRLEYAIHAWHYEAVISFLRVPPDEVKLRHLWSPEYLSTRLPA